MNTLLLNAAVAIGAIALVAALLRKSKPHDTEEAFEKSQIAPRVGNGRWLNLSERIFDPSDARWLEQDLAFPKLARALALDRKQLAIQWLEALQSAFAELIRTPASLPPSTNPTHGWEILWLTLRFKFLVSYALIVVKLFGPYHSLIPSFRWLPLRGSSPDIRHQALAGTHTPR
jgi:hypothetical protein